MEHRYQCNLLDNYFEMVDHHQNYQVLPPLMELDQNYNISDELEFQDFDPNEDLSLWDNWWDDNGLLPFFSNYNHDRSDDVMTDHVKRIDHDDCNVTSGREGNNISTASGADDGGRKRRRWDWWDDDSLPILLSDDDLRPIDDHLHEYHHHVPSHEANCSSATGGGGGGDDGGRKVVGRRSRPLLELEEIEKHFGMPIIMAAKELNVGLTMLKKRCRELNNKRWPHRKLKSLKSLIQNVKELGLKEEMEMLEEHKRMMEKEPEMELTQRTKKLRQACFKFNYKKKRLLIHQFPSNYDQPLYYKDFRVPISFPSFEIS
ncbi:hypothetical protein L6452_04470 [Arctium lappa]|uniref:Uncharacterized protein n=1 Tax=Arctium lappa TaxID=4217 RepID=A0ACB9ED37_ARCLA|nr:hypothetical protein L6452_04470 [Arctium lappa]